MHLEALLARERARTSTFQFHRSDEVIDAPLTTRDPAISKRLMRLPCRMDGDTHAEVLRVPVYWRVPGGVIRPPQRQRLGPRTIAIALLEKTQK